MVSVISVVVILGVLFVPLPFSLGISNPEGPWYKSSCDQDTFLDGVHVSFQWSVRGAGTVAFYVRGPATELVYEENGSSGSSSFTSIGGSYSFCAYNWTASYVSISGTAPVL